jgi:hypothetical protein
MPRGNKEISQSVEILDEDEVQSFDGNQSGNETETIPDSVSQSVSQQEAQKERRRLGALKAKATREKNKKLREQREKLALKQIIGPSAEEEPASEDDWYYDTEEEQEEPDPEDMVYYRPPETGHFRAPTGRSDKLSKKEREKREKARLSAYKPALKQMTNRDIKTSQMEVKLKELMSQNKKLKKKMHEIEKKTPQMIVQVPGPAPASRVELAPAPPPQRQALATGLIDFFAR